MGPVTLFGILSLYLCFPIGSQSHRFHPLPVVTTMADAATDMLDGPDSMLSAAETHLSELCSALTSAKDSTKLLLSADESTAAQYRALLLGRSSTSTATYEELYFGRLETDLFATSTQYDVRPGGHAVSPESHMPRAYSEDEILQKLQASTHILLKSYPEEVEKAFIRGDRGKADRIPDTFLHALYGPSSQTRATMFGLMLKYHTRRRLIDTCVEKWRNSNRGKRRPTKVSKELAARAYMEVIGDPGGEQLKAIDLRPYMGKFAADLKKKLLEGCIGVLAEVVPETTDDTTKERPTVVSEHHLVSKNNPNASCRILVVTECFCRPFFDIFISAFLKVKCAYGLGNKHHSLVRFASKEEQHITIGKKYVYESVPLGECDVMVQKLAEFVMRFQEACVQGYYGNDYRITWLFGGVHTVFDTLKQSLYGAHNDASPTICTEPSKPLNVSGGEENRWLPTQDQLQIFTMWLEYGREDDCFADSATSFVEMVYRYSHSETGDVEEFKPIDLEKPFGIHLQLAGANANGWTHEPCFKSALKAALTGSVRQMIFTPRFIASPKHNPGEYTARMTEDVGIVNDADKTRYVSRKDYTQSIDTNSGFEVDEQGNADRLNLEEEARRSSSIEPTATTGENQHNPSVSPHASLGRKKNPPISSLSFNVKSAKYKEGFMRIPKEQFRNLSINRPGGTMRLTAPIHEIMQGVSTTLRLFDMNILAQVRMQLPCGQKKTVPFLYAIPVRGGDSNPCGTGVRMGKAIRELPVPGQHYDLHSVGTEAGVSHRSRTHKIYCTERGTNFVLIITHSYKNERRMIQRFIERVKIWFKDPTKPLFTEDYDGHIEVHGCGGSPAIAGGFAPSPSSCSKHDATITVPMCQDLDEPINRALLQARNKEAVLSVFVNEAYFNADLSQDPEQDSTPGGQVDAATDSLPESGEITADKPNPTPRKKRRVEGGARPSQNNALLFLSAFYIRDIHVPKDEGEEYKKDFPEKLHDSVSQNLRYREHPHYVFELEPVFKMQERLNKIVQGTKDFQLLTVDEDCGEHMSVEIPVGTANRAASMNTVGSIKAKDIINNFFEKELYKKFLSDEGNRNAIRDCLEEDQNNGESDSDVDSDYGGPLLEDNEEDESPDISNPADDDPQDTENDTARKLREAVFREKGTKATVGEVVTTCAFVSTAGAERYLCRGFYDVEDTGKLKGNREKCVGPLPDESIGINHRLAVTPMSNRGLDVVVAYLRKVAIEEDLFAGYESTERIPFEFTNEDHFQKLVASHFQSFLGRNAGRMWKNELFARLLKVCPIPTHKTLHEADEKTGLDFFAFMALFIGENDSTVPLLSKQHFYCNPVSLRQSFKRWCAYVTAVAAGIEACLRDMLSKPLSRAERVQMFATFLTQASGCENEGNLPWIAQSTFADQEELFSNDPYGEVIPSGIIAGPAGTDGHTLVKRSGGPEDLGDCLVAIVVYVNDATKVPEMHLNILGYKRLDGVVVSVVNLRPFNATDAEHFLCKAWVVAKHTFGHYRDSAYPFFSKAHCHPLRVFCTDEGPTNQLWLTNAMEEIVVAYEFCMGLSPENPNRLLLTELSKMPGEGEVTVGLGQSKTAAASTASAPRETGITEEPSLSMLDSVSV